MTMIAPRGVAKATISAVVTRADGTKEDLGIVSYYHKNPLMRLLWRVKKWLRLS